MSDLHNAIMNLPDRLDQYPNYSLMERIAHKKGHRDARHAAAELACAAEVAAKAANPASAVADSKDAEIRALHRQLAGEKLRADRGWQRAEAKSAECVQLREQLAAIAANEVQP